MGKVCNCKQWMSTGNLAFLESPYGHQAIIDLHVKGIIYYVNEVGFRK